MNTPRIGIDLGGTKTELLVMDDGNSELFRKRVPTPKDCYSAILDLITNLAMEAEDRLQTSCKVGIGIPGAISRRTGLVKNANTTCLIGKNMESDLTNALDREVRIENDANCFTLSEAIDGGARHGELVFGVILGTGVGGGFVYRGDLLVGRNLIAGEWGHNPLPTCDSDRMEAPLCYCGRRGCIETFLSGPGLSADHARMYRQCLSPEHLVAHATAGDGAAAASLNRYVDRLARALATVINVLDPDVVVLGGGMSCLPDLCSQLRARLPEHVFSDYVDTDIVLAQHGPASGVRGAACLWPAGE